jgi:glycosyltransferase involved in cell wall biosynthesis
MRECSVVIPVHNEAPYIEKFILRFWDNLGNLRKKLVEIRLVENGSTDNSLQVCHHLAEKLPNIIVAHHIPQASYGEAIKQGMLFAEGRIVAILECDFLDIAFLSRSIRIIEEDKGDFVLASKRHPDSIDRRAISRRLLTYLFNTCLRLSFRFPIRDTHGLKTLRAETARHLCKIAITGGEIFQTEIVLLAYKLGFRILELPIRIDEQRSSSISVLRRVPKVIPFFFELKRSIARFS